MPSWLDSGGISQCICLQTILLSLGDFAHPALVAGEELCAPVHAWVLCKKAPAVGLSPIETVLNEFVVGSEFSMLSF